MKTIARIIICSFFLVLVTSCLKEETILDVAQYELIARMETDARTKTSLSSLQDGMYYPLWSAGDEIAVYLDGKNDPEKFTLSAGEGTTEASFKGVSDGQSYYAVYPFNAARTMQNGEIQLVLPEKQQYVAGSFGQGAYPMIGAGADGVIEFKNLCAIMKISIKGQGEIRSITLTAKDTTALLSGLASVAADYENEPILKIKGGGSNSVVLECGDVVLSKDTVTDFHIVIPAQTYKGGFEISVDAYTEVVKKNIDSDLEFKRSQIRHLKKLELAANIDEHQMRLAKEKAALIAFYKALDGDNWTKKENWCSDEPVGKWEGVTVNERTGYVRKISISNGNLSGTLPDELVELSDLFGLNIYKANLSGDVLKKISKLKKLSSLILNSCNISGEIPPELCDLTCLTWLSLNNNNLSGAIPENIGNLAMLEIIDISINNITGEIPESIGNLTELTTLDLSANSISGKIPPSIVNLRKLREMDLRSNALSGKIPEEMSELKSLESLLLSYNSFSGSIPQFIAEYPNIKKLSLDRNKFSGILPEKFQYMHLWPEQWGNIISFNEALDWSNVIIPAPEFDVIDVYGNRLNSEEIFKNNKCVIIVNWIRTGNVWGEGFSHDMMIELNRLYELYHEKGLEIIGFCYSNVVGQSVEGMKDVINEYGIKWPNFMASENNFFSYDGIPFDLYAISPYPYPGTPSIIAANSNKEIGYYHSDYVLPVDFNVKYYVAEQLGLELDHYVSKEYSEDGTTVQLQKASEGKGINIVLMGDGYSDRQIADGTYKADMEYAYSNLFTKEPYKSFKNMFNVSYVNVVSATEGFEHNNTALSCGFGDGTLVYGNDKKCFGYAQRVVDEDKMDETMVVVVLNSSNYAGTCYMYYPTGSGTDYGKGSAVAYFPKGSDIETFAQLLHHEANGHGFSKLADEYAYEEMGTITANEVENTKNQQSLYGWWKNIDFTNDPAQVRWKKFLEDSRYANEGLGIFEGGSTYWSGVWRPTENSIMRYNKGEFNAPSREAIYYRIHKLAYGEEWQYDYEKFAEYDAINRKGASSAATKSYVLPLKPQPALHPPVIVGKNWREAGN